MSSKDGKEFRLLIDESDITGNIPDLKNRGYVNICGTVTISWVKEMKEKGKYFTIAKIKNAEGKEIKIKVFANRPCPVSEGDFLWCTGYMGKDKVKGKIIGKAFIATRVEKEYDKWAPSEDLDDIEGLRNEEYDPLNDLERILIHLGKTGKTSICENFPER